MFNEAFWFFYLVGVTERLSFLFALAGWIGVVILAFALFMGNMPPREVWADKLNSKSLRMGVALACMILASTFMPTPTSLYAGAGQYVGESAELDETLFRLKELVDAKIEEAINEKETRE